MTRRPNRNYLEVATWEEKAQANPLYAVMSHAAFASSGEPTEAELVRFYAEGERMVAKWISPWLQETDTSGDMAILEFGCGMGRLLKAVAHRHPAANLAGVDISPTMINYARSALPTDVQLAVIENARLPMGDATFDRVYSYAVFQHIARKSVVVTSIAELGRVLRRGGLVRAQFSMGAMPPFEQRLRMNTIAGERMALRYGWTRKLPIPLPRAHLLKANEWDGIRLGYQQLFQAFRDAGITIYGVSREYPRTDMVWFFGAKGER